MMEVRHYPVQLEVRDVLGAGDGRTVIGRIVPFGETCDFIDEHGRWRKERFVRGSFMDAPKWWHRVNLVFEHSAGPEFRNILGHGARVDEDEDGAYGVFRLYKQDADKAREILETTHKGLSIEFASIEHRDADDGVVERHRVRVYRVAAVSDPAYQLAHVLGVRGASSPPPEPVEVSRPNLEAAQAILAEMRRGTPR